MSAAKAPQHDGQPDLERLLLDLNTVAFLTSLSRAEIEREIARGALASIKRGRRRLVTRAQLDAYVRRLEQGDPLL